MEGRDYFTIFAGTFLIPRFRSTSSSFGGRTSISQRMAKRSSPIWTTIVETPGSSGFENGNNYFWLFFIRTLIPLLPSKGKSLLSLPPAAWTRLAIDMRRPPTHVS
ncbi:MAG: hypothetical protein JWO19_3942 [Bryobacterales bacterium]|nr:hypothetical protein [Bryobacterales bacterium]